MKHFFPRASKSRLYIPLACARQKIKQVRSNLWMLQ